MQSNEGKSTHSPRNAHIISKSYKTADNPKQP